MADLTVNAAISRTELSLADLDIDDGVNYILGNGVQAGAVSWRKETVTSPFYEGRFVVHEVKDAADLKFLVYVIGETYPAVNTKVATLLQAVTEQYSYELKLNVQGQQHTWVCERADYEVAFATTTVNALKIPVQITTMRHPAPTAGAF